MLSTSELDQPVQELNDHKDLWVHLPIKDKIGLLLETRENLLESGSRIVEASVKGKCIDPDSPWVGEEWILGPWSLAESLNGYIDTMRSLQTGHPAGINRVSKRSNDQVVAQVFPNSIYDRLILSGLHAEVWMQPEITPANLINHVAVTYRQNNRQGKVALVLGSGNVSAIPALDVLYRLFGFGHVVILKMNPINDYLGPIFENLFSPLSAMASCVLCMAVLM